MIPIPRRLTGPLYLCFAEERCRRGTHCRAGEGHRRGPGGPKPIGHRQVSQFADSAKDVKTLSGWLKLRYPRLKPTGTTVEELRKNTNKELEAKADQPDWFKNYDITILDDKLGQQRLRDVHKLAAGQVKDMKILEPGE